jgi:hypothetical protein
VLPALPQSPLGLPVPLELPRSLGLLLWSLELPESSGLSGSLGLPGLLGPEPGLPGAPGAVGCPLARSSWGSCAGSTAAR